MRMKILSGPQICAFRGRMSVYVVAQVVKGNISGGEGDVYPIVISQRGTKDVPNVMEIVEVDFLGGDFSVYGTNIIYNR